MVKKMRRNISIGSGLMAMAALLTLAPSVALGQAVICPGESGADFDGDGFFDVDECAPFQVRPGLQVRVDDMGLLGNQLPSCFGTDPGTVDREFCMSAEQDDLYVMVVDAGAESQLPPGPLETAALPVSEGGLGINVHILVPDDPTDSDRHVAPTSSESFEQQAIRITEDLDPDGDKLGQANYGTPNNIDRATIWTARITIFVQENCASDAQCKLDNGVSGIANVTDALARWVMEHEVGHMFKLSADYNKRFGGYHLKSGTDSVMAQFVKFSTSKKTGITTFFIPTTFDPQSQADTQLAN